MIDKLKEDIPQDARYIVLERAELGHSTIPKAIANGEWDKWAEWVKDGIRSNRQETNEQRKEINKLIVMMKVQQVKVGMWGAIGASIPTIAAIALLFLAGKL